MIFPPESVYEFRRELADKMESGELSDAEAFRQALAVDPHDPVASRVLAFLAEEAGDREQAAQLARRAIEANPTSTSATCCSAASCPTRRLPRAYPH